MTTVTPSDRTGTASSAKRPAAIPTQRSDRALRLLVLGTGDDAAAFRERAAEAGAELAQRFSVRVTHVVAEDGIGEQDARVVRARAAGVPVLGLAEGDRLLEPDEREARSPVSEDGAPEAAAVVVAQDGTPEPAAAVVAEDRGGAIADADEEVVGAERGSSVESASESDDEEQMTDADLHRRVVSLIRPRAELTPEPCDVRPSDVFTESALEAVLHFPPLRTGVEEGVPGGKAGDVVGAERIGEKSGDGRLTTGTAASFAWALLPLLSVGLLTPICIGYAAYRLRSRALSVTAACYTLTVAAAFAVSAVAPVWTGAHAATGELLLACLGISWIGGTIHSFLIRRRVWGWGGRRQGQRGRT